MKEAVASIQVHKSSERALLVGMHRKRDPRWEAEDSLEELARLAESAGAIVAGTILQEREAPDPRYLIGKGKAQEIKAQWGGKVDLLVMDGELSGSQQRSLEELTGWKRSIVPCSFLISSPNGPEAGKASCRWSWLSLIIVCPVWSGGEPNCRAWAAASGRAARAKLSWRQTGGRSAGAWRRSGRSWPRSVVIGRS